VNEPLEALYEAANTPTVDLPPALEQLYGGGIGFDEPRVYANFVSTLDGVVAIPELAQSNKLISAGSEGDRFVMGLLRAFADVVLIGAGTLAGSPRGTWTPERAYPPAAGAFAELRRRRGRSPAPELAVLSGRGSVAPLHPALQAGALVLTSEPGAARLRPRLPETSTIVTLGEETSIDPRRVIDVLRERGHRLILSEAGPHAFGALVDAGLVDELFLTLSPLLAGSAEQTRRFALVEGFDLVPLQVEGRLLGLRRQGAHLFLRYQLEHSRPCSSASGAAR
jgi:riboflavin biosynthesis pyrimidine reductase